MQAERPYVLTIAGFDPSSGAGLTADIKAFEQSKVYGLAVCTGLTLQTEDKFHSVTWRELNDVKKEVDVLLRKYPVKAVKFGIVPSFNFLLELVSDIKEHQSSIQIVVDPVWRTSTGFELNRQNVSASSFKDITLLTPNVPELEFLAGRTKASDFLNQLSSFTNILLKGGHATEKIGTDILYTAHSQTEFEPSEKAVHSKHGSGCVLSAVVTAELAKGKILEDACREAKKYIEKFLKTNKSLLGYHAA
jgi:hydroxymethylpyrimidine/phosphomethylpyrimidine kinase